MPRESNSMFGKGGQNNKATLHVLGGMLWGKAESGFVTTI